VAILFKITPDKRFFKFKTGDGKCKVYLIFDPSHLFKSFRNMFNKRFEFRGGFVDWELIHKVYLLSIQTTSIEYQKLMIAILEYIKIRPRLQFH
jgi:hypothetical protein